MHTTFERESINVLDPEAFPLCNSSLVLVFVTSTRRLLMKDTLHFLNGLHLKQRPWGDVLLRKHIQKSQPFTSGSP